MCAYRQAFFLYLLSVLVKCLNGTAAVRHFGDKKPYFGKPLNLCHATGMDSWQRNFPVSGTTCAFFTEGVFMQTVCEAYEQMGFIILKFSLFLMVLLFVFESTCFFL